MARRLTSVKTLVAVLALGVGPAAFLVLDRGAGEAATGAPYVPHDPVLRWGQGIECFVPEAGRAVPPAIVVFFGNDVGFWRPHRRLAERLARHGYVVVGVDIRPIFAGLSVDPSLRARGVGARIRTLVDAAATEFGREPAPARGRVSIPVVLVGHSLGAELALWAAANVPTPSLRGVVAMSPGSRSHLRVSVSDLLMAGEPRGPGSFAVSDAVQAARARQGDLRIAIVRGTDDVLRSADAALLAAGGPQARRFTVPFAGHSMARPNVLADLMVERALGWVLTRDPPKGERHAHGSLAERLDAHA